MILLRRVRNAARFLYFEGLRHYNRRMLSPRFRAGLWVSFSLFAACKDKEPQNEVKAQPASTPAPAPASAPVATAQKPSQRRSSERCIGPFTAEPVKPFKIGNKEWELQGSTLVEKSSDPDDMMTIGVIADLKEDTPENLSNIDKFLLFFKQERVEMIIVDGDTGETKSQIAGNLKRIANSGVPVGIIIGNRECETDFNRAVADVSEKSHNVFNLNFVRHIAADDADLLTLPGYYNSAYLHCATGCQYYEEDVAALQPLVKKAKHPVTLVSHGPPRQRGQVGIDRISEGTNEGDPVLTKFIVDNAIPFGIFANIHEAGGRATDVVGEAVVRENTLADSLYLNPGPGDSVRWTMNGGGESIGMAAVVTLKGKNASYKIFKVPSPVKKR
jgi:Icc-related predicted phosphoesterase